MVILLWLSLMNVNAETPKAAPAQPSTPQITGPICKSAPLEYAGRYFPGVFDTKSFKAQFAERLLPAGSTKFSDKDCTWTYKISGKDRKLEGSAKNSYRSLQIKQAGISAKAKFVLFGKNNGGPSANEDPSYPILREDGTCFDRSGTDISPNASFSAFLGGWKQKSYTELELKIELVDPLFVDVVCKVKYELQKMDPKSCDDFLRLNGPEAGLRNWQGDLWGANPPASIRFQFKNETEPEECKKIEKVRKLSPQERQRIDRELTPLEKEKEERTTQSAG